MGRCLVATLAGAGFEVLRVPAWRTREITAICLDTAGLACCHERSFAKSRTGHGAGTPERSATAARSLSRSRSCSNDL